MGVIMNLLYNVSNFFVCQNLSYSVSRSTKLNLPVLVKHVAAVLNFIKSPLGFFVQRGLIARLEIVHYICYKCEGNLLSFCKAKFLKPTYGYF